MPIYPLPLHADGRLASISDGVHTFDDVRAGKATRQHRGVDVMYRKLAPSKPRHPHSTKWYEIPADYSVPALACETGRVVLAEDSGTGFWVVLDLGGDVGLAYHHLRELLVKPGAFVGAGTPLGYVGGSPRPGDYGLWHLHFDRAARCAFDAPRMHKLNRMDGVFENPAKYLSTCRRVTLAEAWGRGRAGVLEGSPPHPPPLMSGRPAHPPSPRLFSIPNRSRHSRCPILTTT